MVKQITREDILNSKGAHLYNEDTIYVELEDTVYGLHKGSKEWFEKSNFYDYFDSSVMLSYFFMLSREEAALLVEEWTQRTDLQADERIMIDAKKLDAALCFATEKHSGQFRKGTETPFIVHPMEVMSIIANMGADTNLLIAGLLHDTIEDTDTKIEEIIELFGADVAILVGRHSEDKTKSWKERKETEYIETISAPFRLKQLVLADKLANLRSLLRDHIAVGEELWNRFNAGKEQQAWYYSKMVDAVYELQRYESTAPYYWELVDLYKDIFVTFYYDVQTESIYQVSCDGAKYRFVKNQLDWEEYKGEIPETVVKVHRKYAERREDSWKDPYWDKIEEDLKKCNYSLYSSASRSLGVVISERKLKFKGEDFGEECQVMNGSDEYEFSYSLDENATYNLLLELRKKHGIEKALSEIFTDEFGKESGSVDFENFCIAAGIEYNFWNY